MNTNTQPNPGNKAEPAEAPPMVSDEVIIGASALAGTGLIFGTGYFIGKKLVSTYASKMDAFPAQDASQGGQASIPNGNSTGTVAPSTATPSTPKTAVAGAAVVEPQTAQPATTTATATPSYAKFSRKVDPKTQKPMAVSAPGVSTTMRNPKELDPELVRSGLKYARRAFVYGTLLAITSTVVISAAVWSIMGVQSMDEFHQRMRDKVGRFMQHGSIGKLAKSTNEALAARIASNPLTQRLNKKADSVELTQEDYDLASELGNAVETILNYEVDVAGFFRRKPSRAQNSEIAIESLSSGTNDDLLQQQISDISSIPLSNDVQVHTIDYNISSSPSSSVHDKNNV